MLVEIHTQDNRLAYDLLGESAVELGEEVVISRGVTVRHRGTVKRYTLDVPDVVQLVFSVVEGVTVSVAAGLIAAWLYDKLKQKKPASLIIETTEVEFEEGKIKHVIQSKLKTSDD